MSAPRTDTVRRWSSDDRAILTGMERLTTFVVLLVLALIVREYRIGNRSQR
jgi:hypothetical protein